MRFRLLLVLLVVLPACDDGGSDSVPIPPIPPWGTFRHDILNSGASVGIDSNTGCVSAPIRLGGTTLSTPTVDLNGNILIGTAEGLKAYDPDCFAQQDPSCSPQPTPSTGCPLWTIDECVCEPPDCAVTTTIPIGSVSTSPTVSSGNTIIFGSDSVDGQPGYVFAFQEQGISGSGQPTCSFVYPRPSEEDGLASRSSAAAQVNSVDLTLQTAIIGGADGVLRALNPDGSVRWEFPTGRTEPISSSPALDPLNTSYVTAPDGSVTAVTVAGRTLWRINVGTPPTGTVEERCCVNPSDVGCTPESLAGCFQPSPAVGASTYVIGTGGALFAITSIGTPKWQFTPSSPVHVSPAFSPFVFNVGSTNAIDTIVYVVDREGRAYAVRDTTGTELQVQRCSDDLDEDCRVDSCRPLGTCMSGGTCSNNPDTACSTDTCTGGVCGVLGQCETDRTMQCFLDSCQPGGGTCDSSTSTCTGTGVPCISNSCPSGPCVTANGILPAGEPVPISTSPVLSSDPFLIVGTTDGRVCARAFDGSVPGSDLDPPTEAWTTGCAALDDTPTRSSPIIGSGGVIYVTTDEGLYEIE